MKGLNARGLLVAVVAALLSLPAVAQEASTVKPLFEYPEVPEKLTKPNLRANFMVAHLWEKYPLDKEPIADAASFHETFTDYLSFFTIADRDEVEKSIKNYVERVAKNERNLYLTVGILDAEVLNIYGSFCSDDVYTMFAKYLTDNKHVPGELKDVMKDNMRVLANSTVGTAVADMPLAKSPSGATSLAGIASEYTILFFNAPDCVDCSIYKVRLKANLAANTLIEAGVLSIVSVYPEGQTDGIDGEAANWNVASLPDFDKAYDMRIRPAVYFLDSEKRIVAKFVEIDNLLSTLEGIKQAKGV